MKPTGLGQPAIGKANEPGLRQLAALAAPFQHMPPVPADPIPEREQGSLVARHRVISVVRAC